MADDGCGPASSSMRDDQVIENSAAADLLAVKADRETDAATVTLNDTTVAGGKNDQPIVTTSVFALS